MCRKGRSTFISLTAVECVRWTHGIKIERNNLLCEQAPTEVFRSIFAWLVTLNLQDNNICTFHIVGEVVYSAGGESQDFGAQDGIGNVRNDSCVLAVAQCHIGAHRIENDALQKSAHDGNVQFFGHGHDHLHGISG